MENEIVKMDRHKRPNAQGTENEHINTSTHAHTHTQNPKNNNPVDVMNCESESVSEFEPKWSILFFNLQTRKFSRAFELKLKQKRKWQRNQCLLILLVGLPIVYKYNIIHIIRVVDRWIHNPQSIAEKKMPFEKKLLIPTKMYKIPFHPNEFETNSNVRNVTHQK